MPTLVTPRQEKILVTEKVFLDWKAEAALSAAIHRSVTPTVRGVAHEPPQQARARQGLLRAAPHRDLGP